MSLPVPTEPRRAFTPGPHRLQGSAIVADVPTGRPREHDDPSYYGGYLIAESVFRPGDGRLLAAAATMFDIVQWVAGLQVADALWRGMVDRAAAIVGQVLQGETPPELERDEVKALLRALARATASERDLGQELRFAQIERDALRERLGEVFSILRTTSGDPAEADRILALARRDLDGCGKPREDAALLDAAPAMRDALHQILHANRTGDAVEFANALSSAEAAFAKARRTGGTRG